MTRPFVNWSRTVRTQPRSWHRPTTEAQVVDLVVQARREGRRIRACGSRHSWSAVAAGHDNQVDLGDLDRFLDLDADTVTVEAGVQLQTLVDVLAAHGRALPVVGSILEQTVAGATATGTHGSSWHRPNVAANVRALRLVTGTGEVRDLEGDELDALRVHLGSAGLVTRITLGTVPAFRLKETMVRLPFDEAADTILDTAQAHDFCKLWWLPHARDAYVFTYDVTDEPGERDARAWAVDGWVNRTVFPAMLRLGGWFPPAITPIQRAIDVASFRPGSRVGRSDHMLTLVMPPRHRETELAFDVARTPEALRAVREMVTSMGARVDFIGECRFVDGDSGWLSPAYGRRSCQLGVYATHSPDVDRVFAAYQGLGDAWGARPHWGKEHDLSADEVEALYPQARAFRAMADELDPDGLFAGPAVAAVRGR